MLVSCATLAQHLSDSSWIVFDCRHELTDLKKGECLYAEGHIPGAHFARLETDLSGEKTGKNGRHPLPSPAAFTQFLAQHGVSVHSNVVAYDDAGGPYAARLWWLARWIGFDNVHLLDGGITKWMAEGRALSRDILAANTTSLQGRPNSRMTMTAQDVQARLNDETMILIDARAPERYRGDIEPIDPIAGHIPGSRNHFFKNNLNTDLTLKAPHELHDAFLSLMQKKSPDQVVHQCGSGVTACANVFAMEYAGLKGSRLYAGSWSEWIADPARPVTIGN